eukprot:626069-Pelagomonas_calceolata.AAC.5
MEVPCVALRLICTILAEKSEVLKLAPKDQCFWTFNCSQVFKSCCDARFCQRRGACSHCVPWRPEHVPGCCPA